MPLIERVSIIFNEHTDYRTTSDQRRSQQRSDGGVRRWPIKFEGSPAYQSATPIPNATADLAARKAPSPGRRNPGAYELIPEKTTDENAEAHWQRSFELIDTAVFNSEDLVICEQIQRGLQSGANDALILGGLEQNLLHFHSTIETALS